MIYAHAHLLDSLSDADHHELERDRYAQSAEVNVYYNL